MSRTPPVTPEVVLAAHYYDTRRAFETLSEHMISRNYARIGSSARNLSRMAEQLYLDASELALKRRAGK